MHTLLQTSDKRFAVRSLISLCLMEGNPPFGQDKACSTEKLVPQSQLVGARSGSQPYRRHRASRKALLCKVKENSITGRAVSQLDAPFSWARDIERCSGLGSVGFKVDADTNCCERLWLCISVLAFICSSHAS